jgi:hypothetical protein
LSQFATGLSKAGKAESYDLQSKSEVYRKTLTKLTRVTIIIKLHRDDETMYRPYKPCLACVCLKNRPSTTLTSKRGIRHRVKTEDPANVSQQASVSRRTRAVTPHSNGQIDLAEE